MNEELWDRWIEIRDDAMRERERWTAEHPGHDVIETHPAFIAEVGDTVPLYRLRCANCDATFTYTLRLTEKQP